MQPRMASHHRLRSGLWRTAARRSSRWYAGSRRSASRDAAGATRNQKSRGRENRRGRPPRVEGFQRRSQKFIPEGADILHAHFPLKQGPKGVPFVRRFHATGNQTRRCRRTRFFFTRSRQAPRQHDLRPQRARPRRIHLPAAQRAVGTCFSASCTATALPLAVDAARHTGRRLIIAAAGDRPSRAHQVRRRGGRQAQGGVARARPLPVGCRRTWTSRSPADDRGVALRHSRDRYAARRAAEIVTPAVGVLRDTLDELILAARQVSELDPRAAASGRSDSSVTCDGGELRTDLPEPSERRLLK